MGLFGLFDKKRPKHSPKRTNCAGENINRLTDDGSLPFGWMVYHKDITQAIEAEVETFRDSINNAKDPLKKYAALKSYLVYLEDGKKHYSSVGECEGKYFEDYICASHMTESYLKQYKKLCGELKKT